MESSLILTILIYGFCSIGAYALLNECFHMINTKTGKDMKDEKDLQAIVIFLKIVFSATWIVSIPYLIYKGKKVK